MKLHQLTRALAAVAFLLMLGAAVQTTPKSPPSNTPAKATTTQTPAPPNFLFILADDQSWAGLSVEMIAGKEFSKGKNFNTPNTEKLAARGMVFSQAYAAHPKCECSRAAILAGRTTTTLNATTKASTNWSMPLTDSLANSLKRANPLYRAAHLGKWQWPMKPADLGYDQSDGITQNQTGESKDLADPKLSLSLTRRACDFMATQVKEDHPFFLQISFYAVHAPAQALPETLKKYDNLKSTKNDVGNEAAKGPGKGAGKGPGNGPGKENANTDRATMAAMTEDLDTCVGTLMKKLDELGIADNTYIIYMSDNGGRTDILSGSKGNLGEGGLRVPLIVAGPGIRAATYCNEPVISYDILATVLDFAAPNTALPKGAEGGSWKTVLQNSGAGKVKRSIDRMVWHQPVEVPHPQSAIRKGDYKLLYEWDTKNTQLFNLVDDLSEKKDLSKEKPELTAQLTAELKAHVIAGLGEEACAALARGETPQNRGGGNGGKGVGKPKDAKQ
ncbi:MAG: sulfatase-like hydrolase/transferase [Phycisphaerales bacterium]